MAAGCLLALAVPVVAWAGDVADTKTRRGETDVHTVGFRAKAGESNRLNVRLEGTTANPVASFTDSGAAVTYTSGGGCSAEEGRVSCTFPAGGRDDLLVDARDQDDQLVLSAAGKVTPFLSAGVRLGAGDDRASTTVPGAAITGDGGNDTITGFRFADGRTGDDVIVGSAGDDRLTGGRGTDRVRGGVGDDVLDVEPGELRAGDCGPGDDEVTAAAVARRAAPPDCEQVGLARLATIGAAGRARGGAFLLASKTVVRTRATRVELRAAGGRLWGRATRPASGNAGRPGTLRFRLTAPGRAALARPATRRALVVVREQRSVRAIVRVVH